MESWKENKQSLMKGLKGKNILCHVSVNLVIANQRDSSVCIIVSKSRFRNAIPREVPVFVDRRGE